MADLEIGDFVSYVEADDKRVHGFVVKHPRTSELTVIPEGLHCIFNEMPASVRKLKKRTLPDTVTRIIARVERGPVEKREGRMPKKVDAKLRKDLLDLYAALSPAAYTENWAEVDELLKGLKISKAAPEILVGALRHTFMVRDDIAEWYKTRDKVQKELEKRDPSTVDAAMRHLDVSPPGE